MLHWEVMKITTLNLQGFTDWQNHKPAIVAYLQQTNPDIIFFQEVVFIPEIAPYDQVQLLNQELDYPYEQTSVTRLQDSPHYEAFREGLGILSKYPVVTSNTVVLKHADGDEHNRILQMFDVLIGDKRIKLANVHFSLTDTIDFATAHLEETLQIIDAQNEARIIAGDFNINHLEDLSALWSRDYTSSTDIPYISFPAENKRIDYVLVPKAYELTSVETSQGELSDHCAVTIEIDLK